MNSPEKGSNYMVELCAGVCSADDRHIVVAEPNPGSAAIISCTAREKCPLRSTDLPDNNIPIECSQIANRVRAARLPKQVLPIR